MSDSIETPSPARSDKDAEREESPFNALGNCKRCGGKYGHSRMCPHFTEEMARAPQLVPAGRAPSGEIDPAELAKFETELAKFEVACPVVYADHERELLWKGWQLARSATAGTTAAPVVETMPGPWPTVEMTVAGKRILEKQSPEHIKKYAAGIANSVYEAMQEASPIGEPVTERATAGNAAPEKETPAISSSRASSGRNRIGEDASASSVSELDLAGNAATAAPGDDEIMQQYEHLVADPSAIRSGDYASVISLVRHFIASNAGAAPAIPEGYKVVPVEPTRKMCDAGEKMASISVEDAEDTAYLGNPEDVYKAMLAAAPSNPPVGAKEKE